MSPRAPFPYYGSKYSAAPVIEALMGPIKNLVVPFAGSLGELLGRSEPATIETVNDCDGLIVNVWRAIAYSPKQVADLVDQPVHEVTMHAAHDLLVNSAGYLPELLRGGPKSHHVELAAWWIWGRSCWLGGGWCDRLPERRGGTMRVRVQGREGSRPHHGRGVLAQGTRRQVPVLSGGAGRPAHGKGVHSRNGRAVERAKLEQWMGELAGRLRRVRIICGDWQRAVTPAVTTSHGITGVSLDPPYSHAVRSSRLYRDDDPALSDDVRKWAAAAGEDDRLRIVLAGKGDEHKGLEALGWTRVVWRADGETLWASPSCDIAAESMGPLFARRGPS